MMDDISIVNMEGFFLRNLKLSLRYWLQNVGINKNFNNCVVFQNSFEKGLSTLVFIVLLFFGRVFFIRQIGRLHLVATKGTEIIIFRDISIDPPGSMSCEQAPTCHSSPIISMQCVKGRFIVTASSGATQYVDIGELIYFANI